MTSPSMQKATPKALSPIQPYRGGGRKRWFRTEWQERVLRERYDSRTETIDDLARLFGVPRWTVRQWAAVLGLARTKEPFWSREAEEYLERWMARRHIGVIARHLGRTTTAVALKAKRLGLRKSGDGYTMRQLQIALGEENHHKIRAWIESGALKATRRHTNRNGNQGGDMWLFTDKAIRDFIRKHPMEISLRKVDQLWFLDIVGLAPV